MFIAVQSISRIFFCFFADLAALPHGCRAHNFFVIFVSGFFFQRIFIGGFFFRRICFFRTAVGRPVGRPTAAETDVSDTFPPNLAAPRTVQREWTKMSFRVLFPARPCKMNFQPWLASSTLTEMRSSS